MVWTKLRRSSRTSSIGARARSTDSNSVTSSTGSSARTGSVAGSKRRRTSGERYGAMRFPRLALVDSIRAAGAIGRQVPRLDWCLVLVARGD